MDKDFSELIEYLDGKFVAIDGKFEGIDKKFDARFFGLEEGQKEIKADLKSMQEAIRDLTVSIDRLAGAISDLSSEYAAITNQVNRHEKWMHQMADKLGVKLEY